MNRRDFLALCAGSLLWPGVPEPEWTHPVNHNPDFDDWEEYNELLESMEPWGKVTDTWFVFEGKWVVVTHTEDKIISTMPNPYKHGGPPYHVL